MGQSVVRRALYTGAFFVAGQAFYYLLILVANFRLDSIGFGRFYLGWAILNVLVAPGGVATLALSAYFSEVHRSHGARGVQAALERAAADLAPWAIIATLIAEAALYFVSKALGADSLAMIALLPLTALAIVMVDAVRAAFQGMLQFVWFGTSWLAWCVAQWALGTLGLALTGAPWGAFLGMLAASVLTLVFLVLSLRAHVRAAPKTVVSLETPLEAPPLLRAAPLVAGLGGFVLLNNVDVLLAYLTLTGPQLGAYTASAVLPKAIVTAAQPVVQVMLPVAMHIRGHRMSIREPLAKAIGMTVALATLGAAFLWITSGKLCGGSYGINFCDASTLAPLAAAAIPLSVVRTATIANILDSRRWLHHLPLVAAAVFAAVRWLGWVNGASLAVSYSLLCWTVLGVFALVRLSERRLEPSSRPAPAALDGDY
jgi:O-antigen/teichoic acid export membrane protein